MSRQSQEEVAAAARRRLELLSRELEQAGLRRVDEPGRDDQRDLVAGDDHEDRSAERLPRAAVVEPAGRHLPPPRPGVVKRVGAGLGGWVGDQVPATLRGRTRLGHGPVLLVVALAGIAVTAAVVVVLRMGADSEAVAPRAGAPAAGSAAPLVPTASSGAASTGQPSAAPSGAASGTASGPAAKGAAVTVDVAGKVRRPGVATLPAGSRVVDALEKAGGTRGHVDLSSLNLARVLVDGEQILVGRPAATGGIAAGASAAAPDPVGAPVNLNTATAEQLDTLPGVGPVTAQKILEWRTAHGAFSSVDELLEVDGIGEKTLSDLAPHVTV